MTRDNLPPLIQDLLYADQHGLLDGGVGRAVRRTVVWNINDLFAKAYLQNHVHRHKIAQAFAGPFALPKLSRGNLYLGLDARRRWLRCPLQVFNGHCLMLGGSGSGKTTESQFRVLQIAPRVRATWCFDLRKREFAVLRPYLARYGIELIVVPARQLRLNPLQVPDGVAPADWAARAADMLVAVLILPPRATKLLHATIVKLYRRFHIFDGARRYPVLFDLREVINADAKANPQARQAVLDALDPVLLSIGSALAYRCGWTSGDLADRHIVFELGGVAEMDKDLLLQTLLLPAFTSRVARGVSNPHMDLWICLDEAQRLVAASRSSGGISDLIGLVRGTGIGLHLSIQSSADVSPAIYSNTANKLVARCGSAADYDAIGSAMGLTSEQRRYMALHLEPGLFVGQLSEGWRKPFLFRVPPMRLSRQSAAASPSPGLGGLLQLPVVPA